STVRTREALSFRYLTSCAAVGTSGSWLTKEAARSRIAKSATPVRVDMIWASMRPGNHRGQDTAPRRAGRERFFDPGAVSDNRAGGWEKCGVRWPGRWPRKNIGHVTRHAKSLGNKASQSSKRVMWSPGQLFQDLVSRVCPDQTRGFRAPPLEDMNTRS